MYYFFFGVIPLPVNPGALNITTPSLNKTVTLINEGEINILKSPGLKEISFEFLLPQQKYPWANYDLASDYTATAYIPALNELKKSKVPFQFIVTRMKPDNTIMFFTSFTCQIESLEYEEDADAHGLDVLCKITLKEYKYYGTQSFSIINTVKNAAIGAAASVAVAAVTKSRSTAGKQSVTSVTVKKGDTLWNICKKYLGDGSKYKEVAELNKLENPNKIYPGQVLRLS